MAKELVRDENTFVYCVGCGKELNVHIHNGVETSPLRDEEGNPLCETCAIEHRPIEH